MATREAARALARAQLPAPRESRLQRRAIADSENPTTAMAPVKCQ
jgi:hypothetical protein